MRVVSSVVVGVARFLYGFVVGDDWTVALAIVLALVVTGVLVTNHISAWWLVPLVAVFMTGVSLNRSARKRRAA
jgi:uncharacterized protein (DUF58 family)